MNYCASYRVFDWQPGVPWTINASERVIDRMKMRARTGSILAETIACRRKKGILDRLVKTRRID